jgi:hypothetical protein
VIKDCGAACVAIVGGIVGAPDAGFARTKRAVDPDGDGLASMLDLVNGLTSFGIESQAVHASSLSVPAGVNILHVSASDSSTGEDHFIVSQELPAGRYQFYCPPLGVKSGDSTALEGMWSGYYVHVESSDERPAWYGATLVLAGLAIGAIVALVIHRSKQPTEVARA